jgi:hypothetical protein
VIDTVDQQLSSLGADVLPGSASRSTARRSHDDVGLSFEMADLPPAGARRRPPLQVRLGYLVTTSGTDVRWPTVASASSCSPR